MQDLPQNTLLERLFSPGERWGWEAWNPESFFQPFREAQPVLQVKAEPGPWSCLPKAIAIGLGLYAAIGISIAIAQASQSRGLGGLGVLVAGMIAGTIFLRSRARNTPTPRWMRALYGIALSLTLAVAVRIIGPAAPALLIFWIGTLVSVTSIGQGWLGALLLETKVTNLAAAAPAKEYEIAMQRWQAEKAAHDAIERDFVNSLPIYGTVAPLSGTRRVDVYGGTPGSWQALITTYGTSCIGTGNRLTIIDLSELGVANELCQLATLHGIGVDAQQLPEGLPQFDALAGLSPNEIKDILIETIYGDQKDGTSRRNRALDDRVLGEVCALLAPRVTVDRILAALRSIAGQEPEPSAKSDPLSPDEWFAAKDLFKDEVRREMRQRVFELENQLHSLRGLGSDVVGQQQADYPLRLIALSNTGTTLLNELIVDLLPQLMIRSLRNTSTRAAGEGVFIVVGADALARRHLEKLSELSYQRGARLIYLFRHLREDTADFLGNGESAALFMRLGSAKEATQAAEYIGKVYKFELSQLSSSTTRGTTITDGTSESESYTTSGGFIGGSSSNSSSQSTSHSVAESISQTDGTTTSRVYEFVVEPTTLQELQEAAFLLVQLNRIYGKKFIKDGNCNPNFPTLDRVSLQPLTPPVRIAAAAYQSAQVTGT